MTVRMKGIGDAGMNPPTRGAKGARLEVFAFFLKSSEEFEKNGLDPKDFLTPELRERLEVPPFLKSDAVAVRRLWVQPGERDPTASAFDVSKEAVFIGLVTRFQDHRDDDTTEKWRLVLPTSQSGDGVIRFYVTDKRLEARKPEVVDPPAVSSDTPEKAK